MAAIEHPFAQTVGKPGDTAAQTVVLRAVLEAATAIEEPGGSVDLPFSWTGTDAEARGDLAEQPPITPYLMRHPWHFRPFLRRDIPEQFKVD